MADPAPAAAAAAPPASPFMNGNVIDGKAVAAKIREEIAAKVAELKEKYKRVGNGAAQQAAWIHLWKGCPPPLLHVGRGLEPDGAAPGPPLTVAGPAQLLLPGGREKEHVLCAAPLFTVACWP